MPRYNVEYMAHVYVTVPVDAADRDAAEAAADAVLPKYPVVVELSDQCPAVFELAGPGKHFELHEIYDQDEGGTARPE